MNQKNLHIKLAKALAAIFESSSFDTEVQESAIETFNKNLYSLLQQSSDITITNETLDAYALVDANDPIAQIRFITNTLENDTTYILLNYYIVQTIKIYAKSGNDQQKKEIATTLQNNGLNGEDLDMAESHYQRLVSGTRETSVVA